MPRSKKALIITCEREPQNTEKRQLRLPAPLAVALIALLFTIATMFAFTVFYFVFYNNNDSKHTRDQMEAQYHKIQMLSKQLQGQEEYMKSLQTFFGKRMVDTLKEPVSPKTEVSNYEELSAELTENEQQLFNGGSEGINAKRGEKYKHDGLSVPFNAPIAGYVSQKFNKHVHEGTDIVAEKGSKIRACMQGKVVFSGYGKKDGQVIVLAHPGGWTSVYKHLKTISVKSGMYVKAGQAIGIVGNSGENSNGPHLHFELWQNGSPVNPATYITFKN
jgi:murein DD-endopeptidase MepM/ murein hydrolase activator NlpD